MNSRAGQLSELSIGDRERPRAEHGQPHRYARSLPQLALNLDLTALQIDTALHNDETKSRARTVGDVIPTMKSVKEPLAIGFCNSNSLIPDRADNFRAAGDNFEPNRASGVRILYRVRQQVCENMVQQPLVSLYFRRNVGDMQLDRTSPVRRRDHLVHKPPGECVHIHRSWLEFRFPGLQTAN